MKIIISSKGLNSKGLGVLTGKLAIALLMGGASLAARAGTFSTEFNSGLPAGAAVFGSAFVDNAGGVGDSGVLKLTQAYNYGSQGSFIINDLDGGAPIAGFTASFKLLVGGAEPHADGCSFNFANDLPDGPFTEEGAGTGVTISFDSFDNGGGEAPAIDAKIAGVTVASTKTIGGVNVLDIFRTWDFVDVLVRVNIDGSLDLTVNGIAVYSKLPLGFTAIPGRFGFGARTGGYTDNHFIDNLSITTTRPTHPYVTSAMPRGLSARPDSVIALTLQDANTAVNTAAVKLTFNGTAVKPTVSKVCATTTILYDPPGLISPGANSAVLTYADNGTPSFTNCFAFTFSILHYQGPNGNYYELVPANNIPLADAKAAAEQRTFLCGNHGHLVTITSAEEDVFFEMLRQEYIQSVGFPGGEVWAGGFQSPNQATPGDGWFWVNNEGPIAGYNGGSTYANWNLGSGEPNDCCNTTSYEDNEENYLGLGLFGFGFGWNDDDVSHNNIIGYVVEYERLTVPIDIKPGGTPNSIYLDTPGKLPVAIISTPSFDASTVDPSTVTFGRTGNEASPVSYALSDVNGDKRRDLVCQFNIQDTALLCGDTSANLRAKTFNGCSVKGVDSVQILRCPPYALSIQSVEDVHHLTDVYLKVTPILQGHSAPTLAQSIALKSYDIFGNLRWTKTVQNASLTPDGNGTTAHLQYTDMEHGQNVKVQMQVKDTVSGVTEVLPAQGRVLFRPDLAVDSVTAPSEANLRQVVNIFASVKELKGDLGATANVYLKDGNNVIDIANNISLNPLGSVGVAFVARFDTEGLHQLKVVVADEVPADYDSSNNEKGFGIQVIKPVLQPVFYCASYSYSDQDYHVVQESPYWINTYNQQYTNEYLSQTLYLPTPLQTVARVTLQTSGDGIQRDNLESLNIPLYSYSDGCYSSSYGSQYIGDNIYFYIQSYQDCYGYQYSYAGFQKYAYNVVYFSTYYDKVWGTTSTDSGSNGFGNLLSALSSVQTRFIVEGDAGAFGGSGNLGILYPYPYDYQFDYYDYDYSDNLCDNHITGHQRGRSVYGSACDVTTP